MYEQLKAIAYVQKTHAKSGKVVAVAVDGLPALIEQGMELCPVPPQEFAPRWYCVDEISSNEAGMLLHFAGIDNLADAETLVNKRLLARVSDLPQDYLLYDVGYLLGHEVFDKQAGITGSITEVIQGPANDAWTIAVEGSELVIPVIDDVVLSMPAEGPIELCIPQSLLLELGDA